MVLWFREFDKAVTFSCDDGGETDRRLVELFNRYHLTPPVELAEAFLRAEPETVQIFAVWGHSYEFEVENTWQRMEEFCRLISGRADVFYGTNSEVLLADRP